jgi:carbonic anhydrase
VKHVMVVGHYGCSGVDAALRCRRVGLADNWLRHVQDVCTKHRGVLDGIVTPAEQADRLCELNVIEQVANVAQTTIVRDAWERGQDLTVHGWIYGLKDGRLRDLNVTASNLAQMNERYAAAVAAMS